MVALYPLALAAAGIIIWRRRGAAANRGWPWFVGWTVAGGIFTFSFLAGFSIGLFFLPLAAATLIWVARRAPGREAVGFLDGVGVMLLVIAFINRDYTPCPPGSLSIPPNAPPGTSVSCGGADPQPWLVSGLIVSTCAILAYGIPRLREKA